MRPMLLPGQLEVKLRLGEAPSGVSTVSDIRVGLARPAGRTGLGAVDRVLQSWSDRVAIGRVHGAACSIGRPGHRHVGFDELEHVIGLSRTFAVRLDRDAPVDHVAEDLRNIHEVETARPVELEVTPFLTGTTPAGVLDRSRAVLRVEDALSIEPGHPSVVVAILDTGVRPDRSVFGANLLQGFDTVQLGNGDLEGGLQLLGDTTDVDVDPGDEVGHGTACAGIIAGSGRDDLPPGLAGACTVLPVRVLGSVVQAGNGQRLGVGSPIDIDAGVKRAVDLNAKVLNCSFGTPLADGPSARSPHADVVAYAVARGCVVVAASGNSGHAQRYTPAALDDVLAVGSIDQDGAPSSFTSRGSHVALSAPGRAVVTAGLDGPVVVTGTSFAAPFAAATAALLVSLAVRRSHPLGAREVIDLLRSTARPWPDAATTGYGAGILDPVGALRALADQCDTRPQRSKFASPLAKT